MKNIKAKEEEIINEFKNIVIVDNDGSPHQVPILYATQDKLLGYVTAVEKIDPITSEFKPIDIVRLPVIGLCTNRIGHNHFIMDGVVHTLWRENLSQIIEQFHHTVELNDKIMISDVIIENTSVPYGSKPSLRILTGKFTVEYRE